MTTQQTVTTIQVGSGGEAGMVNGPDGLDLDWDAIDWRRQAGEVRRLRSRIFKAAQAGDQKKVRNLQKLALRSWANTLVSVRQVTQRNNGRATPGVDGEVALTASARARLAVHLHQNAKPWQPLPVKRVYIAKKGGKLRPLGIPAICDRVQQARVKNALEPEWEARMEPRSYGYRPGRSCQDAIGTIYTVVRKKNTRRLWALDADLSSAFDTISHRLLLSQLGLFPARDQVGQWLKAGVVDRGRYTPTDAGTPQGGVLSPLLLNIALHGMETAAGVRYYSDGRTAPDAPVLVRYADDYAAFCHSRQQAEQVKQRLAEWLAPRGLSHNEDKTRIVHVEESGFDFLGYNVRRYQTRRGGKLLIKPSKDAVRKIRQRLATEVRTLRGAPPNVVIGRLNPIIRGWAAHYRSVVSSEVFSALDDYLWRLLYQWACHRHPDKPKRWVTTRYFGRYNPARQDKWVYGDRDSGAYLHKFAWTPIVRHVPVKGAASPDDPALVRYWADRRRKQKPPPLAPALMRQIHKQRGRCPECGDYLLHADHEPQSPAQWEAWFTAIRTAIVKTAIVTQTPGRTDAHNRLVHSYCRSRHRTTPVPDDSRSTACTPSRSA